MKRGTKFTVFIISMAATVGSLIAVAGPRHHWRHGCGAGKWHGERYQGARYFHQQSDSTACAWQNQQK
jgi:hypothetical protein